MIEHTPTVKKQHTDDRTHQVVKKQHTDDRTHLVVKKQHTDETPDGPQPQKGDTAGRVTSLLLRSYYLFHVKERAVDNLC